MAATEDLMLKSLQHLQTWNSARDAYLVILPPGKGICTEIKAKESCNCVSPGDFVKMQTLNL